MKRLIFIILILPLLVEAKISFFNSTVAAKYSTHARAHVGEYEPACAEAGQVLYLHGHADRFENHEDLFHYLNSLCLRVISFDWPGHGDSDLGSLDLYSFSAMQDLAVEIFKAHTQGQSGAKILMAWSFGGLVATRILQSRTYAFDASILFVPALSLHPTTGGDGIVRIESLTQNRRLKLKARPSFKTPLQTPLFAVRHLYESAKAKRNEFTQVPTLVVLPDPKEDLYVNSQEVEDYFQSQKKNSDLKIFKCKGAMHALDFELTPYQNEIRPEIKSLIDFLKTKKEGSQWKNWSSPKILSAQSVLCNYK